MTGADPDPCGFLAVSRIIDHDHRAIREKARELSAGPADPVITAERCFLFVRYEILHSGDYALNPVTLNASDVLKYRTGFCYAKSHLLAALLRANGIPAGLCYQRLALAGTGSPFALHGLNAVYLPVHGWHRIDARGNRPGIDARFRPPDESLAFVPRAPGERDLPGIFAEPLPEVVEVLGRSLTFDQVLAGLPDRLV